MKAVIQRVSRAHVEVDEQVVGRIDKGLLVLLGIAHEDTQRQARWLAEKVAHLRIFSDENDKMNHSVKDVSGGVLVISQFTLYANCLSGRRPDFIQAARPDEAISLYDDFLESLSKILKYPPQAGIFGAKMQVHLVNDGPVTIPIDAPSL